jgi:alpha-L-rhamnosidase
MPTWFAQMVAAGPEFDGAPLFRRQFTLETTHGDVASATLRYTALGVCEVSINGSAVSADVLTPGWSSYEWRLRYAETDVTNLLAPSSVIGIAVGNGWFRGRLGWSNQDHLYGDELAVFAQLEIRYADGFLQRIGTDESWQAGPSAVTSNGLYEGQRIDARLRDPRWLRPEFQPDGQWTIARTVEFDTSRLAPYVGPPVVRTGELAPKRVWTSPSGATLIDFGQNITGWIRIRVRGEAGTVLTVRHAEVLEADELGTRPLRTAQATDEYTLSGRDDEFEPTFTFHGFRYAEVSGWPSPLAIDEDTFVAVTVGSDLDRIGTFECSDPMLNRLHQNVVWSTRDNFLDIPTDCPQRDERLGWTGDIAVFAPTSAFLFDVSGFLRDWLLDLAIEQREAGGTVPMIVPDAFKYLGAGGFGIKGTVAIWSDAAVWVPWALWQAYGDPVVLEAQFDSIVSHVRAVRSLLSPAGLWDTVTQLGDWLDPDAPPNRPRAAKADPSVVATACAYRTAILAAEIAAVLDRPAERAEFAAMATELYDAFNSHYVSDGTVYSDCPTVYALAIVFGLLGDTDCKKAGERLAELVEQRGFTVTTGFAGTPFITDALTQTGHVDMAYRLLLEKECPSWLYPVTMGATTIWERWDSMLPDGTVNPGDMTSFNHYALGAVADWMHRTIGGISPLEPGYRSILVAPQVGGGLTWAATSLRTPHGPAAVRWELTGSDLALDIQIPESATGILQFPGITPRELPAGRHRISVAAPTFS